MEPKALRRACWEGLRDLGLSGRYDLETLCLRLGRQRGRAIRLVPMPAFEGGGPCGVWVATTDTEFVFYRHDTSRAHQSHIVLHELAHMILDHQGALDGDYRSLLLPNLDATAIQRILGRSAYSLPEERDAELFATLMAQRMGSGPAEGAPEGLAHKRMERILR